MIRYYDEFELHNYIIIIMSNYTTILRSITTLLADFQWYSIT